MTSTNATGTLSGIDIPDQQCRWLFFQHFIRWQLMGS